MMDAATFIAWSVILGWYGYLLFGPERKTK